MVTLHVGNTQIIATYHWLQEIVRDGEIDLRDIASLLNLVDFLTNVVLNPAMWSASDAACGYTKPPEIPPALKYV